MQLKPQLQHHQDPNHRSVIAGMDRKMFALQAVDEIGTNDSAPAQRCEVVAGKCAQTG